MKPTIVLYLYILLFLLLILLGQNASAQKAYSDDLHAKLYQTIRGRVVDSESGAGIPGANIVLLDSEPLLGCVSDLEGHFRLEKVPVGRRALRVSFVGYEVLMVPEIMVGSAKEVVLSLSLEESSEDLSEVIVRSHSKSRPGNKMATVSARSFSVEETQRYAGSVGDPGRMALSFAGINTDDDASNAIVIRGNSPASMLWRVEGVEIPVPNHFYMEGWGAGYVSLLNTNMMGPSDFFTGAFPAEYGNSTSGVFDISLRNGNNEQRENTFEFGVLGLDLCTEGPFSKDYKGSYLINYRYATFSLMNHLGIRIGGDLLPAYSDLSGKLYFPTGKYGTFSIWGLGGTGFVGSDAEPDSLLWEESKYERYGWDTKTRVGAAGITHTYFPDERSYFKTILSVSGSSSLEKDYELKEDYSKMDNYYELLSSSALRFSVNYNRKLNSKLTLRTGLTFNKHFYHYYSKYIDDDEDPPRWIEDIDGRGNTESYQGYFQARVQPIPKLYLTAGVHYLQFALSHDHSLEPRVGFRWELPNDQAITGGFGRHSQHDKLMTYFFKMEDENGLYTYPNKDLSLQRSNHFVLGYTRIFNTDLKFQAEVYFQDLSKLPVSIDTLKNWSPINDDIFGLEFVSEGKGKNYGLEITLEKYFTHQYYFLFTSSLFSAKYKPLDGRWYNSRYNNNYITNFLGGKEFTVQGKNIIGINGRFIWSGGRRYTPIDESLTGNGEWDVYDHQRAYRNQLSPYLRLDISFSYKINKPRVSHEFSIDIQNVTARENEGGAYYSSEDEELITYTLQGILPIINYRIRF